MSDWRGIQDGVRAGADLIEKQALEIRDRAAQQDELRQIIANLQREMDELKQWRHVQRLTADGPENLPDAVYPQVGKPVVVWMNSATGEKYVVHTIRGGPGGNWSWPSFGLAWKYLESPDEEAPGHKESTS